jgi:hypothetical protein
MPNVSVRQTGFLVPRHDPGHTFERGQKKKPRRAMDLPRKRSPTVYPGGAGARGRGPTALIALITAAAIIKIVAK